MRINSSNKLLWRTNTHDGESYMRHQLSKLESANTAVSEYEGRHTEALVALEVYEAVNPTATLQQTLTGLGQHEDAQALFRPYEQCEGCPGDRGIPEPEGVQFA
jgi:hypothetical protein